MKCLSKPFVSAIAGVILGIGAGNTQAGLLDTLNEVADKVDQVKDLGDTPKDAEEALDRLGSDKDTGRNNDGRKAGAQDTRRSRPATGRSADGRDNRPATSGASAPANTSRAVTQYVVDPGEFMPVKTRNPGAMAFSREKVRYWLQTKVALTNHETRMVAIGEKPNRPMRERFLKALGWKGEDGFNAMKNRITSAMNIHRRGSAVRQETIAQHTDRYGSDPREDWQAIKPYQAYWESYKLDAVDHGMDYQNRYADLSGKALRPDKTLDPSGMPLNRDKVLYWMQTRRAATLLHKRLMARKDIVDFSVFEPAINDLLTDLGWSSVPRSDFASVGARIYSAYNLMGAEKPLPRYIGNNTRQQALNRHEDHWGSTAREDWKALKPYLEHYKRLGMWIAGKIEAPPELPAL